MEEPNRGGRPRGSHPTTKLRERIRSKAEAIVDALLKASHTGDVSASKVLLERILPAIKTSTDPTPLPADLPRDAQGRVDALIGMASKGEISLDVAHQFARLAVMRHELEEASDLAARLEAIEERLAPAPMADTLPAFLRERTLDA